MRSTKKFAGVYNSVKMSKNEVLANNTGNAILKICNPFLIQMISAIGVSTD